MKTIIIGASGLVGRYLYKVFYSAREMLGTSFPEAREDYLLLDVKDKAALRKVFNNYNPELVLCPAAISNVEFCQKHRAESRAVNVEGINNVITEVERNKSKLVFFSSEYVFDGKFGPYVEEDIPEPINEYGKEKLEIEEAIQKKLTDYIIVRTTVVYGREKEGKNFVEQILQKLKQGSSMRVPIDQYSSPTYAGDLANAIKELVYLGQKGIFNIAGSQVMNRYEFAKVICNVFDLNSNLLIPVETSQLNQIALRPLKAGLRIDKVKGLIHSVLHTPLQGLNIMKEEQWPLV